MTLNGYVGEGGGRGGIGEVSKGMRIFYQPLKTLQAS